jgi:hypothetical protein
MLKAMYKVIYKFSHKYKKLTEELKYKNLRIGVSPSLGMSGPTLHT